MYQPGARSRNRPMGKPGKPALLSADRPTLELLAKARDGLPKKNLNPFKLSHLLALEYAAEKGGVVQATDAGLRWLTKQE